MKSSQLVNIYHYGKCERVCSVRPVTYGAVAGLLSDTTLNTDRAQLGEEGGRGGGTDRVFLSLEVSAGLGGAAGPVVEGLDGAGGASEVLETAPGGTAGGGTLYHAHQDVPLPLSGPSQGEGDLGLVRGELPRVQVDMLTRVETTDRRRVVSCGCPGPLHNRLHYRARGGGEDW